MRGVFWLVGLALAVLQAWVSRHWMNPDGVAYLDLADAWRRGDWASALSTYWSPFYSWLLALALGAAAPSTYWEFPLVHLVNLGIFVAAFGAFEFLLDAVIGTARAGGPGPAAATALPESILRVWGYTIFLATSLDFISVGLATPDLAVAACVYLAAGIVVRISRRPDERWSSAALGVVLGIGYLVKAVMLPVAVVFVALAAAVAGSPRRAVGRALLTVLIAGILAAPYVTALSLARGRLALGDSGKLNYAWVVNRVPFPFDQPGVPTVVVGPARPLPDGLRHPPRRLLDRPLVYEFAEPVPGTNPLLYDPTYWYAGLETRFSWRNQLRALVETAKALVRVLLRIPGLLAGGFLLFYLRPGAPRVGQRRGWVLLPAAAAGGGVYALVWVEPRYLAPFVTLAVLGGLLAIELPRERNGRLLAGVTMLVVLATLGPIGVNTAYSAAWQFTGGDALAEHWRAAEGLRQMGLHAGDPVAGIGRFEDFAWARLARARIVAAVGDAGEYWDAPLAARVSANAAFAAAGARIIITRRPPRFLAETEGWKRIGETDYYARVP